MVKINLPVKYSDTADFVRGATVHFTMPHKLQNLKYDNDGRDMRVLTFGHYSFEDSGKTKSTEYALIRVNSANYWADIFESVQYSAIVHGITDDKVYFTDHYYVGEVGDWEEYHTDTLPSGCTPHRVCSIADPQKGHVYVILTTSAGSLRMYESCFGNSPANYDFEDRVQIIASSSYIPTNMLIVRYPDASTYENYLVFGFDDGSAKLALYDTDDHTLTTVTDFTSSYSRYFGSDEYSSCRIIGTFPYLFVLLGTTRVSATGTKELWKLTSNSTSSWTWEYVRDIGEKIIVSESETNYTLLSSYNTSSSYQTKVWKLIHESGVTYPIYLSDDPVVALCPTYDPSCPFIITDSDGNKDGTDIIYFEAFRGVNNVKSYHYINGIKSVAEFVLPKSSMDTIKKMINCVIDIYNPDSLYHPSLFDFRDSEQISYLDYYAYKTLTITEGSISLISSICGHNNCLWLYDVTIAETTTLSQTMTVDIDEDTSKALTHGTVSIFIGGACQYHEQSTIPDMYYLQLKSSTDVIGPSISIGHRSAGLSLTINSVSKYIDPKFHYIEFEFECTTGQYKGLSQYTCNILVDREIMVSDVSFSSSVTNVFTLEYIPIGTTNTPFTIFQTWIDAISFETNGDFPLQNYTQGDLCFRGYLSSLEYKNHQLTAHLTGIDKELNNNSNAIEPLYRTSKILMESIVDGMDKLFHNNTIDYAGRFTTERIIDYSAIDYTTIIDDVNDLEDAIEYRDPTGRMTIIKISDIYDANIYSTPSSKTYKVLNSDWDQGSDLTVNRVVVYGAYYSDGDGNIKQIMAISQDEESIATDGLHETIYYRENCKTPAEATSVADNIRGRFGTGVTSPYQLITARLKGDWMQVGTKINFEHTNEFIDNADRIILSQEYDYTTNTTTIELCESVLQSEDPDKLDQIRDTQKRFKGSFVGSKVGETTYLPNDQMIYKNSIASIQTGNFRYTPVIVDTGTDGKTAIGVLGKEWVVGDAITDYDDWTGDPAIIYSEYKGRSKVIQLHLTNTEYISYAFPDGDHDNGALDIMIYHFDAVSTGDMIIGLMDGALLKYSVKFDGDGFYIEDGGASLTKISNMLTDVWNHVRIEWSSSQYYTVYLNGTRVSYYDEGTTTYVIDRFLIYNNKGAGTTTVGYVDAIGLNWLGYRPYTNIATGVLDVQGIVEDGRPRGLWFHWLDREPSTSVDYSVSDFTASSMNTLSISSSIVPSDAKIILAIITTTGGSLSFYPYDTQSSATEIRINDERKQVKIPIVDGVVNYYRYTACTAVGMTIVGYWN